MIHKEYTIFTEYNIIKLCGEHYRHIADPTLVIYDKDENHITDIGLSDETAKDIRDLMDILLQKKS